MMTLNDDDIQEIYNNNIDKARTKMINKYEHIDSSIIKDVFNTAVTATMSASLNVINGRVK